MGRHQILLDSGDEIRQQPFSRCDKIVTIRFSPFVVK